MIGISEALTKLSWADSRFLQELESLPDTALAAVLMPGEWTVAGNVAHWAGTVSWYHYQLGVGPEVFPGVPASMADVSKIREGLEAANAILIAEGNKSDEVLYWEEDGQTWPIKRSEVLWRAIAHSAEHKSLIVATLKVNGYTMDEDRYGIWGSEDE